METGSATSSAAAASAAATLTNTVLKDTSGLNLINQTLQKGAEMDARVRTSVRNDAGIGLKIDITA